MSSKFFTWTKGDRRNVPETPRSAGIARSSEECITFQGMEYGRGSKGSSRASRKPLPLAFDRSPDPMYKSSNRTDDSIALHDAAVQSATSLMHVVNDMLQSPHVSAHLTSHQRNGLVPMYQRPRSRTAPSTPLVEAPAPEPVELPGSLLAGKKSIMSLHQSIDGKGASPIVRSPVNTVLGAGIPRPHSSPQEATDSMFRYPSQSTDSLQHSRSLYPPPQLSPRSKSSSPHRFAQSSGAAIRTHSSESTLAHRDTDSLLSAAGRPALSVFQQRPTKSPSISSMRTVSHNSDTYTTSQHPAAEPADSQLQHVEHQAADVETALLEQISLMRTSHEAHLSRLREAHEMELESHRMYISFLEKRRGLPAPVRASSKGHLTIDTSHTRAKSGELRSAEASATTLQSLESIGSQKRASQEAAAEAEALKRKLSLAKKTQVESTELRRERDHLRDTAERSDRRIGQLKDIVRKSKDQEKVLKNAIADLEARLVAANNERTDVLEGFHEASEQVRKLAARESMMKREIEDLRSRLFCANGRHASDTTLALPETNATCRPKHHRTKSDVAGLTSGTERLLLHNSELRRLLAEKEARIQQLQDRTIRITPSAIKPRPRADDAAGDRISALEASLYDYKKMLETARVDCERYNVLLHTELRRQSRQAVQSAHGARTPKVEAEELRETTEKVDFIVRSSAKENAEAAKALLERELEYCLKEIVLYKLDIRGYKKDVKRAQAQVAELQAVSAQRPPTPNRDSGSSTKSDASSERKQETVTDASFEEHHPTSGLGISLQQPPQTLTRALASATAAALLSNTPALPSMPTSPPPPRPKTPLSHHKRLPKPPASRTPSPLPTHTSTAAQLQRGETLRSLSESIISSYARRGTPEQGSGFTPPARAALSSDVVPLRNRSSERA